MRRLLLVLLPALLLAPALRADEPLRYTAADSVSLEDMFWTRATMEVWELDSTLRARPVAASHHDARRIPKMQAQLAALGPLTLWGGAAGSEALTARHLKRNLQVLSLSARLFLLTRQVGYADLVERTLYNSLRAATQPALPRSARRRAAPWLLAVPGMMYAGRGADVYVNLYMRSRAWVRTDSLDFLVLQNTSAPWQNNVFFSFRFAAGTGRHMRLHLRLPGWLRGEVGLPGYTYRPQREFYELTINGRASLLRADSTGYITIDRTWQNDDVMTLKMDTPVRRILCAARPDSVALQFGPLVYRVQQPAPARYALRPADAVGYSFDDDSTHAELLSGRVVDEAGRPHPFTAVPYYIAASRPHAATRLWLPLAPEPRREEQNGRLRH